VWPITGEVPAPQLGLSAVTPVRLLLLALVVTDLLVPAGMSLSSSAVAVAASEHVECAQPSHDGDDEHARGSLVRLCVCCSAETETAAPRCEPTPRLPSEPHDLTAASAPITDEHVRLPFRPPMAA
jgi:hypothetical protein